LVRNNRPFLAKANRHTGEETLVVQEVWGDWWWRGIVLLTSRICLVFIWFRVVSGKGGANQEPEGEAAICRCVRDVDPRGQNTARGCHRGGKVNISVPPKEKTPMV